MSNSVENNAPPNASQRTPAPAWAQWFYDKLWYGITDLGGGPRTLRLDQAINLQKYCTVFVIYAMMNYFNNFSVYAWIYLGLHGTYGYTWLIKDLAFSNTAFEKRITIPAMLALYGVLLPAYWALPWLFLSRHIEPSGPLIFSAIAIHTLGIGWMVAADLQKNCVMRFRKGLISDGVFTYTRNPNYLGEIMIYWTYALLAAHWLGWLVVLAQLLFFFLPRMLVKDASISRHPGWAQYHARSGLLIPWRIVTLRAFFDK